tara:strand:- start:75 stop:524 length:450 start_codon:yes stop_codon:yes gene_type:complete
MKNFKQHLNESVPDVPALTHVQSAVNPDGQLIKIMSDGSRIPYGVEDVQDQSGLFKVSQKVITDIIKDSIPFYAKPFVEADLDNWQHILQILGNWGEDNPIGYYLPTKYTARAEKALQKVIDGGEVHPDINYNAWILEILQGIHDMLTE